MLNKIKIDLQKLKNPKKAKILARFFKTGKGEYGEGDKFLGIMVPEQRKVAKHYLASSKKLDLNLIQNLLSSKIHEYRLTALFILIGKYQEASNEDKKKIYNFYLKNTKNINNWDLIDLSAPKIIGDYLLNKRRDVLYKLAKSKSLWERRISVLSTAAFIQVDDFRDTLKISHILLQDTHDLIHKAAGWMLREVGKRNLEAEEKFLQKYHKKMPRTMLRYAIERFPERKRKFYLKR